jgi:hypothetical protein
LSDLAREFGISPQRGYQIVNFKSKWVDVLLTRAIVGRSRSICLMGKSNEKS